MRDVSVWQPIVLGLLSAYPAVKGLASIRAARARRRWREVEAEIIETDLDDGPGRAFSVVYRYAVGGREYRNDHILPGQDVVLAPESLDLFRQYPRHRHTIVFYDPDDPSRSALDRGEDEVVLRPIIVGAAGLATCAALLWMTLAGWP